jgi:hypothetical protein
MLRCSPCVARRSSWTGRSWRTSRPSPTTVQEALQKVRPARASRKNGGPPDVLLLQLPHDLAVGSVVSLVLAAARAGYDEPSFLVSDASRASEPVRVARLPVTAFFSRTESATPEDGAEPEKVLHVHIVQPDRYALIWKMGETVVSTIDVPRADREADRGGVTLYELPALADKVESEWRTMGVHRELTDASFDRAVIHLEPQATHAYLVGAIDALLHARRPAKGEAGKTGRDGATRVPAFRVAIPEPYRPQQNFGRLGQSHGSSVMIRQWTVTVNGRLSQDVIQRVVRQSFGRFRLCYENGLRTNPKLAGRVTVKFTIDGTGAVSSAADDHSTLPDQGVVSCVVRGFGYLAFPHREIGEV